MGFRVVRTKRHRNSPRRAPFAKRGNADDYNYKKTIVVYNGTDSSQVQKIADLLGVGTVKKNDGTYSFTADYLVVVGQDWK